MQFNNPGYFLVHLLTHADISQQKSATAFIHADFKLKEPAAAEKKINKSKTP